MTERARIGMLALALLAAGLALRLWHVFAEPLWLDEAYSAYAADHGFRFLWTVVPRYETHPPFFYSLLHLWVLLAGDGIVALRLPGIVAGVATPAVVAACAAALGQRLGWTAARRGWLVLAALGLACGSIPLVEMTRQVRPYPLMILDYAVAIRLLLRLEADADAGRGLRIAPFAAYLLALEAMLWLHNMGPLFGVALTLALGCAVARPGLARRDAGRIVAGHGAVALLYLPGLAILAGQAPTWAASTWLRLDAREVAGHLQMLYAVVGLPALAAVVLAGLGTAALHRAPAGWRIGLVLVLPAVVPVALSLLLSVTVAPVFITRTMTPVAVPAILLFAVGAAGQRGLNRWIGLAAVLLVGFSTAAIGVETRAGGGMQDWYGTVAWLSARVRPGDQVFAYPNEGALPLAYALRDKGIVIPIRSIPAPVPAFADYGGWYPTGSRGVVSLPAARLHAIAAEPATQAVPTIWLLRLGAAKYDPGDVFLHELHRGRYVVRAWQAGPIDIVGLRRLPPGTRAVRSPGAPGRSPR